MTLFGFGVSKKDGGVGFNFREEEKAEGVNKFDKIRRSIAGEKRDFGEQLPG